MNVVDFQKYSVSPVVFSHSFNLPKQAFIRQSMKVEIDCESINIRTTKASCKWRYTCLSELNGYVTDRRTMWGVM